MALGDSYAAGINAKPSGQLPPCSSTDVSLCGIGANCTTNKCARNTGAYGYQFYQTDPPKDFTFVACSGDDTEQCADLQVPKIPDNADLVTINIGGNNGRAFSKVVTRCIYLIGQFGCKGALKNAHNVIEGIDVDLDTLFSKVKARTPTAEVIVFGYVQFWPSTSNPDQCQSTSLKRPSAIQKVTMNTLVLAMNGKLAQATKKYGFKWVDADKFFEGHRLCDSNDPYIQWSLKATPGYGDGIGDGDEGGVNDPRLDLFNLGVFHPFEVGHSQYRMALEEAMRC